MGSPSDLTLGHTEVPRSNSPTTTVCKTGPPFVGNLLEHMQKVEEYLRAIEDERHKIEAFKRELPLCMQLLDDAIKKSKEQLVDCQPSSPTALQHLQLHCNSLEERESDTESPNGRPMLEEFLPLKRRWERHHREDVGDDEGDQPMEQPAQSGVDEGRPSWIAEAQLWTQQSKQSDLSNKKESSREDVRRLSDLAQPEQEQSSITTSQLLLRPRHRPVGAFQPFIREPLATAPLMAQPAGGMGSTGADCGLLSVERVSSPNGHVFGAAESEVGSIDINLRTPEQELDALGCKDMGPTSNGVSGAMSTNCSQSQRKSRRCWSPELHGRFVSALQQLGGSQVATPKQIRELMKVDGLTNDEVKSHLQKYRLHTRRPLSLSPQTGAPQLTPQLVVLGGIWVPPQYAKAAVAATQPSTGGPYDFASSTPTQQSHYRQPSLPEEYFSGVNKGKSGGPLHMHHPPCFEPQQSASQTQSSPQGPLQITNQLSGGAQGISSDIYHDDSSGEEGKSESTSWKGRRSEDEGENGPNDAQELIVIKVRC